MQPGFWKKNERETNFQKKSCVSEKREKYGDFMRPE